MARRTKIVGTIGPSSRDPQTMSAMMHAGMDVARIALAHTPLDEAIETHQQIRDVAEQVGRTVATMIDLPGPLVRTGFAPEQGVIIAAGDEVDLVPGDGPVTAQQISISYPALTKETVPGDTIHIGESVVVSVLDVGSDRVHAVVMTGGPLRGRSAVEVPVRSFRSGALADEDRDALAAFTTAPNAADIIVVSARSGSELDSIDLPSPPGGPLLVAKVQSMAAIDNLASLIASAHGILIDRGGLGLQARLEELPHIQKQVIEECIAGGLPVITASQMLDSMIVAPVPTRAETTDVTNAIFDGTSGVMLAAETAIGAHPVAAVETMARIAERADDNFDHAEWGRRVAQLRVTQEQPDAANSPGSITDATITDAMTIGVARTAESLNLRSLVCISASGFTVRSMARFRPEAQIIGVSRHLSTVRQLAASWGVDPIQYTGSDGDYEDKVDDAIAACRRANLVSPGELVGVVAGITSANRATDTFRIVRVPD